MDWTCSYLQVLSVCSVNLEWVDVGDTDQFSPACAKAYEAEFEKAEKRGSVIKALVITNPHNPLGMVRSCELYFIRKTERSKRTVLPTRNVASFTTVLRGERHSSHQ